MDILIKYFPDLSQEQIRMFGLLDNLYREWNEKINVISRKDVDNLYIHHVLHSLAIAKFIDFKPGTKILDLGTGGGFPGIPLAILFPECSFLLVDSIQKKINVVHEIILSLGLKNAEARQTRAEDIKKEKFDFVVTRAVAKVDKLLPWSRKVIDTSRHKNTYPNGLLALKGHIREELKLLPKFEYTESVHLYKYFKEEYFEEKYLLYVQA